MSYGWFNRGLRGFVVFVSGGFDGLGFIVVLIHT